MMYFLTTLYTFNTVDFICIDKCMDLFKMELLQLNMPTILKLGFFKN